MMISIAFMVALEWQILNIEEHNANTINENLNFAVDLIAEKGVTERLLVSKVGGYYEPIKPERSQHRPFKQPPERDNATVKEKEPT